MRTKYLLLTLSVFFIFCCNKSFSQSYGLGFYSHEVVQDQRTGLDLSPGKTLCFSSSFEVAFDLSFMPDRDDYFGYILRFVDNNNENIDLIYDKNPEEKNHFKLIIGDKFSKIAFNIPSNVLFSSWNTIKFKFDYEKQLLSLSYGKFSSQTSLVLKKDDCFKILFGANEYLGFKTTDVPPMKIKNVKISQEGDVKYIWKLDEYDGTAAREQINNKDASVVNPLWIKKLHHEWQLLKNISVKGAASVAFDTKNEVLNIVGVDSLFKYHVKSRKLESVGYLSGNQNLLRGNQSLFDNKNDRLLNFYIDQKVVSTFDTLHKKWSRNFNLNTPITDFWQYNKFYSAVDSSLYLIGGYGHFFYKNQIQRYHFPSGTWQTVKVSGDRFTPRYLAALGSTKQGAYIFGGYGSSTGEQMLNPRNLYDLLYFDVRKQSIKKIYELKTTGEHFVFANSLIINEKDNTYYALIFPKHKYKSSLQLIHGSLLKPEYKLSGSPIPYLFHDINSFADLFYCAESKRFIAVTLFRDESDHTNIQIYSLYSPPINADPRLTGTSNKTVYFLASIAALIIASIGLIYFRKRNQSQKNEPIQPEATTEALVKAAAQVSSKHYAKEFKSSIFLFGDMQVFDKEGQEITKQFTPLIKELFLIILLYTIRWERGISSEKLKELLWFDKSEESARNNRSVNIAKLKSILEKLDHCVVSKETGYWKINCDFESTFVDYYHCFATIKDRKKLDKDKVAELAEIIKRGAFLPNANYEWMDQFKAEISNEIIDTYLHFAHSIVIADNPDLLIELANYIFYFDPINEEAMIITCKALVHLGKHSQAKNTYENFCKEYKLLYGEEFNKSFNEVLSSPATD
ncbi:MAG: galactose oxidase [Candidatus Pedobacter colombiensis]|uniref:Galactose oxidase n=1 Tax=Candidatus Pedobacter colombiensis TaxID=3121371 RepID=A0AAJ5W773_9SPHI|nr:galactose oxidase [Pedobacter sp.]WEK17817.1 MAG: galactose oxidase [Pedobacter sp.]